MKSGSIGFIVIKFMMPNRLRVRRRINKARIACLGVCCLDSNDLRSYHGSMRVNFQSWSRNSVLSWQFDGANSNSAAKPLYSDAALEKRHTWVVETTNLFDLFPCFYPHASDQ